MLLLRTIVSGIVLAIGCPAWGASPSRPNILWISSEDHGPQMGCYGDHLARTPHVDQLAARGLRFAHCWSNAPVCAPARTAIITGIYPTSLGAENMRSMVAMPDGTRLFPSLLREAGYYCSNNAKEDYNVAVTETVWDESNQRAHWRNRSADQPFFAVFNSTVSHESGLRNYPGPIVTEASRVRVPSYHPDTPEVRRDWAVYYDLVSKADAEAGRRLREIDEAGLSDQTIVFYFGDHGSGMPRSKRAACNSGLQVPLVVYIPEPYRHFRPADYVPGGVSSRLISFVDFAPTVLNLAGLDIPDWMQGRPFLGADLPASSPALFGFKGKWTNDSIWFVVSAMVGGSTCEITCCIALRASTSNIRCKRRPRPSGENGSQTAS